MNITGKDIWLETEKCLSYIHDVRYPKQREMFREYVEKHLLDAIGDMLDKPATLENIYKTKIAYTKDIVRIGLPRKLIEATPDFFFKLFGEKDIAATDSQLKEMIETLELIVADVNGFLKKINCDDLYAYKWLQLSSDNIIKAQKGCLTIGELMLSQPHLTLKITYGIHNQKRWDIKEYLN